MTRLEKAILLLLVLFIFGVISQMDYEDQRAEDCARKNLFYDKAKDKCYGQAQERR